MKPLIVAAVALVVIIISLLVYKLVSAQNNYAREALESKEALRQALEQSSSAIVAQDNFRAMMSHELRTPLTAIMGYVEILMMGIHGKLSEEVLDDLGRVMRSSHHLLNLINGILDFTRMEGGYLKVRANKVSLVKAISEAVEQIELSCCEKGHTLTINAIPEDCHVRGDVYRIKQVLTNLLSNAVKFTPKGGDIQVFCEPGERFVCLKVTDNGIGMTPDETEEIFEPFFQLESGLSRTHGGTGLGLTVARQLARAMGGEITVESRAGVGSTFTVSLPKTYSD